MIRRLTVAIALPHFIVAGRDAECESRGHDELFLLIVHQRVLQARRQVGKAVAMIQCLVRLEFDVAILGGDQSQPLRQRVAQLHRVNAHVSSQWRTAAFKLEGVRQPVLHENRPHFARDPRVLEENRIGHRADGFVLPRLAGLAGLRGQRRAQESESHRFA